MQGNIFFSFLNIKSTKQNLLFPVLWKEAKRYVMQSHMTVSSSDAYSTISSTARFPWLVVVLWYSSAHFTVFLMKVNAGE